MHAPPAHASRVGSPPKVARVHVHEAFLLAAPGLAVAQQHLSHAAAASNARDRGMASLRIACALRLPAPAGPASSTSSRPPAAQAWQQPQQRVPLRRRAWAAAVAAAPSAAGGVPSLLDDQQAADEHEAAAEAAAAAALPLVDESTGEELMDSYSDEEEEEAPGTLTLVSKPERQQRRRPGGAGSASGWDGIAPRPHSGPVTLAGKRYDSLQAVREEMRVLQRQLLPEGETEVAVPPESPHFETILVRARAAGLPRIVQAGRRGRRASRPRSSALEAAVCSFAGAPCRLHVLTRPCHPSSCPPPPCPPATRPCSSSTPTTGRRCGSRWLPFSWSATHTCPGALDAGWEWGWLVAQAGSERGLLRRRAGRAHVHRHARLVPAGCRMCGCVGPNTDPRSPPPLHPPTLVRTPQRPGL